MKPHIAARIAIVLVLATASVVFAVEPPGYAIVIHGGAGANPAKWTAEHRVAATQGMQRALKAGVAMLENDAAAVDVVQRVISILEDDPIFNAGKGAVLNAAGRPELDASIMDGRTKACGAVAGATRAKNPIKLAALVMTKTRHVLLAGDGADRFAAAANADVVEPDYFVTPAQKARWQAWKQAKQKRAPGGGTVGCVVLDAKGNLAAGTSTGGLMGKMVGRVGDSPIVGAGTYADNASCGVSCTGVGEEFIRLAVAHEMSALVRHRKMTVAEATEEIIHKRLKPGYGGLIAIGADGAIVAQYNTPGMTYAAADSTGRFDVVLATGRAGESGSD